MKKRKNCCLLITFWLYACL